MEELKEVVQDNLSFHFGKIAMKSWYLNKYLKEVYECGKYFWKRKQQGQNYWDKITLIIC